MPYIGNKPLAKYATLTRQTFSTPTGTSHTLSQTVTNSDDLLLYINNVKQNPADYTASGTTLTTASLAGGTEMYCLYYGKTTETVAVPASSVGDSHMVDMAASKLTGALPALDGSALTAVLTRAKGISSTYDVSTASGTQDVTGFGFNPRFVIGFGSIEGTDTTFMGWTEVGVMDRSTGEDGATGNSFAYGQFPVAAVTQSGTKTISVVSSISDGVRFTWTKTGSPTGTLQLYLLGFK